MGSLALRLACSPCKASPVELLPLSLARLLVERAIYKISSFQNIRSARLILALQRRKGREEKIEIAAPNFALFASLREIFF